MRYAYLHTTLVRAARIDFVSKQYLTLARGPLAHERLVSTSQEYGGLLSLHD